MEPSVSRELQVDMWLLRATQLLPSLLAEKEQKGGVSHEWRSEAFKKFPVGFERDIALLFQKLFPPAFSFRLLTLVIFV